jgi:pimeloyl-ACP methyl ester carboxylesterase
MTMATHDERFADLPNGTRLCWASHGDEAHPPVLLIAGLGLQLVYWPEALIRALTQAGHRVIVFDNRDAGRSTRAEAAPPSKWQQLLRAAPADAYALEDMAEDTALLMRHLGLDDAHVVGMSMGGMIGQALAAHHAPRVRSLTSIFSTTGHRRVGQPAPSTLWRLASARRPTTVHEAVQGYEAMMEHIGDPTVPDARRQWADYAALAWHRNGQRSDAWAFGRQIGAVMKSGDRTAALRGVRAPTLVVHGDVDRMVDPSGGEATAAAIPGARHVVLRGMRHQIDPVQSGRLAPLLLDHFASAARHGT